MATKILRALTPAERLLIEPHAKAFRRKRDTLRSAASALLPEVRDGASLNPDTLNLETTVPDE